MVGENIKGNLQLSKRVENTKSNLQGMVSDLKEVFSDLKERVVNGTEPTFCKRFPGLATGRSGSLAADVIVLPVAVIDRLEDQIHGFAQINHSWVKRR